MKKPSTVRAEFEKWISSPPIEKDTSRHPEESAWPGSYSNYETELAWEAWQAARTQTRDACVALCQQVYHNTYPMPSGAVAETCALLIETTLKDVS